MILLLLLSVIDINIYSNKDTYLLGESVIVWWEIVNTGDSVDYYESGTSNATSILMGEGEHLQFHDATGREVPGDKISGISIATGEGGIPKVRMEEIEPGDTVKSSEKDLIGFFGALRFSEYGGLLNKCIKPGEYFLSFYVYGKADRSEKIYSDTLHFFVKEPAGKEKEAWQVYKDYMVEDIGSARQDKQMTYALELLKKYPESVYTESLLSILGIVFSAYNSPSMKEGRDRMQNEARQLVDYLKKNFGKIKELRGDKSTERIEKDALWSIIHGEEMLGTPKEEVKNIVNKLNAPLDAEMQEFFEIKPEIPDTKKN